MITSRLSKRYPVAIGVFFACAYAVTASSCAAQNERLCQTPDSLLVENVHSEDGQVKSIGVLDTRLHLYIYVPRATTQFSLGIYDQDDDAPASKPSSFVLYAPDGREEQVLNTPHDGAWSDYEIETGGRWGVWRLSVNGPQDLPAEATNGKEKARNYFMARTRGEVDLYLKPEPVMRVRGLRLAPRQFGGATGHSFTVQLPQNTSARFNFLWPTAMTAQPQWKLLSNSEPGTPPTWTGLNERDDRLSRDLTLRFLKADFPLKTASYARLTIPEVRSIYGLGVEQELRLFCNESPLMPLPRRVPVKVQSENGTGLASRLEVSSPQTTNELYREYSDGAGQAELHLPADATYRVRVTSGFEYTPQEIAVDANGKAQTVVLKRALERWPGWYCGDNHVHTLFYDGTHTPTQVVEAARAAGLDWLTMSEHGHSQNIERAELVNAEATALTEPGHFLVLPGMEYTGPLFHANILGGVVHVPEKSSLPDVITAASVADSAGAPVTIKLNHPSLGKTAADEARQLKALPMIELWNSSEPKATELWWEMLNKGMRTFAETSSDSHHRENLLPGKNRTYIYLGDQPFTGANIIRALREGRSFLSRGALLDFALNGARPGASVPNGAITINLAVQSSRPVENIDIVRNGVVVQRIVANDREKFTEQIALPPGTGWYLARVMGKGDPIALAMSNPIWVRE